MTTSQLTGALYLATMWKFMGARKKIIQKLARALLDNPVARLSIAEKYDVPAWKEVAFCDFLGRKVT